MITLNGSIQRRFFFPADPLTTLIYFSDLSRVTYLLPHIKVIDTYTSDKVRIHYQTVELGAYTINIYCDLESTVDVEKQSIVISPLEGCDEVVSEATLNATTGYGFYTSSAQLFAEDGGTGIDYSFQFQSSLQRPRGLRMVPKRVVDRITHSISLGRVEEIANGFMHNALEAFEEWRSAQAGDLVAKWLAARQGEPAALAQSGHDEAISRP
jgi:hypothetical protein